MISKSTSGLPGSILNVLQVYVLSTGLVAVLLVLPVLGQTNRDVGVLVMAHGGGAAWNQAVYEAVEPLREEELLSVAFGMADPATLQQAVDSLEKENVSHIVVVRMFLSGDSFLHDTEYLFGTRSKQVLGVMQE